MRRRPSAIPHGPGIAQPFGRAHSPRSRNSDSVAQNLLNLAQKGQKPAGDAPRIRQARRAMGPARCLESRRTCELPQRLAAVGVGGTPAARLHREGAPADALDVGRGALFVVRMSHCMRLATVESVTQTRRKPGPKPAFAPGGRICTECRRRSRRPSARLSAQRKPACMAAAVRVARGWAWERNHPGRRYEGRPSRQPDRQSEQSHVRPTPAVRTCTECGLTKVVAEFTPIGGAYRKLVRAVSRLSSQTRSRALLGDPVER
jgi:hypothetical protein